MLQATIRGVDLYGKFRGVDLYGAGGFAGFGAASDPSILALQQALAAYATKNGHPEVNPGATDGVMSPTTRNAVVAVVSLLPGIPSDVRNVILAAGYAASISSSATDALDKAISGYASQLAAAINLASSVSTSTASSTAARITTYANRQAIAVNTSASWLPAAVTNMFTVPAGQSWYDTTWGKGAIVLGAAGLGIAAVKLIL